MTAVGMERRGWIWGWNDRFWSLIRRSEVRAEVPQVSGFSSWGKCWWQQMRWTEGVEERSEEEDYKSLTNMGHHVPCSMLTRPPQSRSLLLLTGSVTEVSFWVSPVLVFSLSSSLWMLSFNIYRQPIVCRHCDKFLPAELSAGGLVQGDKDKGRDR